MKIGLIFILFLGFLVACNKPDPEPEKKDPIYSDLLKEKGAIDAEIAATEKALAEHQKTLDEVKPQTGQIKYAQKRYYEADARLNKLRQLSQYYETRAQSRKLYAKKAYLKAFNEKQVWPDPKEWEQYQMQQKLEKAPESWNVKKRLEESQNSAVIAPTAAPPEGGEE